MSIATMQMLTQTETAARLRISTRTLRRLREEGQIGYTPVGSGGRPAIFHTQEDIDRYLNNQRIDPVQPKTRTKRKAS